LVINLIPDPSVANAPAGFLQAVTVAAGFYESTFTDPITINIAVGWQEVDGQSVPSHFGESLVAGGQDFTYQQVRAALAHNASSPADVSGVANLPAADPTDGGSFFIDSAEEKALGLIHGNAAALDGWVGFGSGNYTFDPNHRAVPGQADFIGIAEHEISEVMGRFAILGPAQYSVLDLFRYSAPTVRELAPSNGAYFSINGGDSPINTFNGAGGGDLGDWAGPAPDAFDASLAPGENDVTPGDITEMNVLGYDLAPGSTPSSAATTADMILRDAGSGNYEIYDIGNNAILGASALGHVGTDWQFAGLGDFSDVDTTDMILRNATTGAFEVYDISNNGITAAAPLGQVSLEWQVSGFGSFSGPAGGTDMMMRDTLTGTFEVYDIANNSITSANAIGHVGLEWKVAGFGYFNGDATTDMLLRDVNNGAFEVYDIAHNQLTGAASLGQVGLEWQVGGFAVDPPTSSQSVGASNSQLIQATAGFASPGTASGTSLSDWTGQDASSQLFAAPVHSMM
jgi:hypothetical protein